MTNTDYTEDELEEIELLRQEAKLMNICIEQAIEDCESVTIIRQIIEEAPMDNYNYSYSY